jgi:eukaryotic-like serine/threonine-protein kinase
VNGLREQLHTGLSGNYRIERELGRGGTATVFLAQDLKHDRPVALKVLHPDLAAALGPERFRREISFVARLQHPHIVTLLDSGDTGGRLWFTMPYVEGETLRSRLQREQRLPLEEALAVAREVGRALDYAHEHGVVHRDIKPENIFLATDGSTLLADFGIARALDAHDPLTLGGVPLGTPAYMSPEQANGEPVIDARTDIYSLGAVLYEMLAGEPPYTGSTWPAVLLKRFTTPAPSVRQLRPNVPDAVDHTIQRALARDAADRFASAADFVRALQEGPGVSARSRLVRQLRRIRTLPLAGFGLGLLLGLGLLFGWLRFRAGPDRPAIRRIAVLPFVNLNQAEDEYFAEGITDDVRGKLAALPGLQVTARSSSGRYAKSSRPPQEIGRDLGVEYLLTGTVRWEKGQERRGRVRVSPELVQASTGSTRWQQTFEAPLTNVFQVQADIAGRVAQALDIALAAGQRQHLAEQPTGDLAAYDLYLRGQHAFHRRTAAGLVEARSFFEQAIALDPRFALPHAGLADVYVVLPFWMDVPPRQTYPRAVAAALKALELDSMLGRAHAALADARALYEWDWTAAERGFKRALELEPNNANTHHWYGEDYLMVVGRTEEGIREGQRARVLDPLSTVYATTLAQSLLSAGRYDEALALANELLSLEPDYPVLYETRGRALLHTQRLDEAVEAFRRNLDLSGRRAMARALLGYAYARMNRRGDAERILEELRSHEPDAYASPTAVALLHAGLGDTAEAFRWLEAAAGERDPFLIYFFVVDPILAGLREDPRGVALLGRMNLAAPRSGNNP